MYYPDISPSTPDGVCLLLLGVDCPLDVAQNYFERRSIVDGVGAGASFKAG